MATSETKEQIIRLGEILVASLGEKHEVSPACHWMSHYLAEQMTAADTTFGEEREQAQKSCFDTILRLWKARRDFPRGVHVLGLEDFQPIFETLSYLNPDSPRFWDISNFRGSSKGQPVIEEAMNRIVEIDRVARRLIERELADAAYRVANKHTSELIEATSSLEGCPDLRVVEGMLRMRERLGNYTDLASTYLRDELTLLDGFIQRVNELRDSLSKDLEGLDSSLT
ncbi:MAG: hypothetical protein J0L73_27480 [Verrucomicrobia bacterium]|nr:hypothetical protein [Verrucomicrobiota bacterium]